MALPRAALLASALATGCAVATIAPAWLTELVDTPGATGEGFGDPTRAVNGVRGGGEAMGSTDTYSLDYGARSSLTLGLAGRTLEDGPGPEIVVFENAFRIASSDRYFMDLAVVSVSFDGESFVDFPHDYVAPDETAYSSLPGDWLGFAGRSPVFLDVDANPIDPFDAAAGGDRFDLADLPDDGVGALVRSDGFRFVRITSATALVNPDTGEAYPRDLASNGPDIDGVYVRGLSR